jgi:hypothetical protein
MAIFPSAVSTDSDLYIAVNQTGTQLTDNPLTAGATTVNVVSTTGFPSVGFISIDLEIIKYTGITATSFTGCTRASDGTSASAHVQNSQVYHNVIAAHHNVLKDEIIAIETSLDLTASRAIVSNASGRVSVSATTAAEIAFVSGVTSAIQTQLNSKAPTASPTFTGVSTFAVGTAALPSIVFSGDPDTGIFWRTSNAIGVSANGSQVLDITSTSIESSVLFLASATIRNSNGTVSAPAYAFQSQTDMGLYRNAADSLNVAIQSTNIAQFQYNGGIGQVLLGSGTNTVPSLCFANNAAHGFYRVSGLDVTGSTVPLAAKTSSVSAPGFTFEGDENTGLYRIAADNIGLTVGGTKILDGDSNGVEIKGTTTNDNATAGFYGESVRSSVPTNLNAGTSAEWTDLTSISLTAGDWLIFGSYNFALNGATVTGLEIGISTTSGNSATGLVNGDNEQVPFIPTSASNSCASIAGWRLSLSASATAYLKSKWNYSAGTPRHEGVRINAVRIR